MKRGLAGFAVLLVTAALPGAASAATYCVNGPCASGATTHGSLQAALDAANVNGGRDRVEIGPGAITTNASVVFGNAVDLVGSGRGSTFLDRGAASSLTLSVAEASSAISDLTIRLGAGAGQTGMQTNATSERIAVLPGVGTTGGNGVSQLGNATIRDSRIALPVASGYFGLVLFPNAGQTQTVEDVSLEGQLALDMGGNGTANVRRVSVSATNQGIRAGAGTMNVSSTLVVATGGFARAFSAATNIYSASPTLNLRHVTAVGGGSDSEGIAASAVAPPGLSSLINVRDAIVRGFATDLKQTTTAVGSTATINVAYSDFASTSAAGPGGIVQGAGNVNVDPAFVDAPAGNYRLAAGSALIDVGDPASLDPWASLLDLDRLARVADGNQDGAARGDMGAYERQPPPAPVDPSGSGGSGGAGGGVPPADLAPVVSSFSLSNPVFRAGRSATPLAAARPVGTRFRFRLSEDARIAIAIERKLPGVRVRYRGSLRCLARTPRNLSPQGPRTRCTRYESAGTLRRRAAAGRGSVAFSGRMGRRALAAGEYRATIRATDSTGKRSAARRIGFRIVKR
ncbi:MAG TPA: hypothetical protein VFB44_07880 [Thermoleophilaceae bacterium]|nr:hypothetical protein [Thermoleophilaceae bacterium]